MNAKCICHLIYLRLIWFCSLPSMILLFDIGKTSGSILQKKKKSSLFLYWMKHIFCTTKRIVSLSKRVFYFFRKWQGASLLPKVLPWEEGKNSTLLMRRRYCRLRRREGICICEVQLWGTKPWETLLIESINKGFLLLSGSRLLILLTLGQSQSICAYIHF